MYVFNSRHEHAPLTRLSADVPRHLERIVSKALAKDKAKRYQTVTDFKLDLEQLREELHFAESEIRNRTDLQSGGQTTQHTDFTPSHKRRSRADTAPGNAVPTISTGESVAGLLGKHKAAAVSVAAIAVVALIGALYLYTSHRAIESVAVLPFVNDRMTQTPISSEA